ncbi:hypothetical protein KTU01_28690 [Kocuria turfanensis]|uniref:Uncharacterized protein n=1 Tax=Kocuria turfanensis TaxID=388357 RepID=A0A512IGB5_9MICC|nr:hypothetical protein KTU01_28690 [Kocuria turfanensis]
MAADFPSTGGVSAAPTGAKVSRVAATAITVPMLRVARVRAVRARRRPESARDEVFVFPMVWFLNRFVRTDQQVGSSGKPCWTTCQDSPGWRKRS